MKAPKPKIRELLREHGIRQAWVGRQIGMSPSLFRHYLDKDIIDEEVEEKVRKLLHEHAKIVMQTTRGTRRRLA